MVVDDAHTIVQRTLVGPNDEPGLHDLRLADLNETEREHALTALKALHRLDDALECRSEFTSIEQPSQARHGGDE